MPSLLAELCRLFNAKPVAMMCVLSHGQLTIDGWIIRPHHLERWTPEQLRGRYARLFKREARLYG